jgi:hypothetical protein
MFFSRKGHMNNQKDSQKTDLNSYGQTDAKALVNKPLYEYANKKTEKLVTALYMVTDCMDMGDAIKGKLRLLGVDLLSDMYHLSTLAPIDKHTHISSSLAHIYEIISFVEIAATLGYVSEMNTSILKREFLSLIAELKSFQSKDKHFTFTLDTKMFETEKNDTPYLPSQSIKDKRTFNMSDRPKSNTSLSVRPRRETGANPINKQERTNKILTLIKDKREVSIKDISVAFSDVSEKTIQRELNALVSSGQIKKVGAKRWSRYLSLTR